MEIKMYCRKRKREKAQQIDHIPNCFQLRRSPYTSKPRTDFSLFISSPKDLEVEHCTSKEVQSSVGDIPNGRSEDITDRSANRSIEPKSKREVALTNCIEVPATDVESCGRNLDFQPCSNRNDEERGSSVMASDITPSKSRLTESSETCATPGSVVWAKADRLCWWPAEVLGGESSVVRFGTPHTEGHILVQYFGKHDSAWVDPATDLSPFEERFEERSCNQAEEFQNALKQALNYKKHPRLCEDISGPPNGLDLLNHCDQLPEKDSSSSSSKARTNCSRRVRSKRERKRKIHFDEVSCPLYTARKVRRFKIMRSLGLAAPVGSPFNS